MELACPHCSTHFEFEPVTVLTPDSEHLPKLLHGTLNCVACPKCQATLNVPVQLIYRDHRRPFMVVQTAHPLSEEEEAALALKLDESATEAAQSEGLQRPIVRLVFSRPDFIEKIALHQQGLDDRIVEYAKYQLFNGGAEGITPQRHRLLFDFTQKNAGRLTFIIYDRKTGRPIRVLQVPMEEFQQLVTEIQNNAELQAELDHCFPGCQVDIDMLLKQ